MNPIRDEWTSPDGSVRLLLGDCLEILPTLDREEIGAVVTDPPYGIGEDGGAQRTRGSKRTNGPKLQWDRERPPKRAFELMLQATDSLIIWGGNYFADYLPPSRCWLYWDKLMGGDFSDGELAWTSLDRVLKSFRHAKLTANRQHTTQKPVALMEWCLSFLPNAETIADPYMGSGTTGVACIRTQRRFIGIEIEPKYFEIAVQRCKRELDRFPLFEQPVKSRQRELLP